MLKINYNWSSYNKMLQLFKKLNFDAVNGVQYCSNCCKIILKHYNPFKHLNEHTDNDSNHSQNKELTDCIGLVAEASQVLK